MWSIQRIVHASDFSPTADRALEHAVSLAGALGASLLLVHSADRTAAGAVDDAERELADRAAAARRQLGPDAEVSHVVRQGFSPRVALLGYCEEVAADLLVVGTRGHTGLARVRLGSFAEAVVRHATCPVLTVGGGAAETSEAAGSS